MPVDGIPPSLSFSDSVRMNPAKLMFPFWSLTTLFVRISFSLFGTLYTSIDTVYWEGSGSDRGMFEKMS